LKICFEKLEKKKKIENQLISVSARFFPQPAAPARLPRIRLGLLSARPVSSSRSPAWAEPRPPAQLAACAFLSPLPSH
jgi:hypothetical protein